MKNEYITKYKVNELTPVEYIDGIYVKRDDLYMPFTDAPLSGGKVRQAISLIGENYDYIKEECSSSVVTTTNLNSPQGVLVSKVATEFGFIPTVYIGHTTYDSIMKKPIIRNAEKCGAKFNLECGAAFDNVVDSFIRNKILNGEKSFYVRYGVNYKDNAKSIFDTIKNQTSNLPDDLDYLIVPCGSCLTLCGILMGMVNTKCKVIGIQISGIDESYKVKDIVGNTNVDYELIIDKTYKYHKKLKSQIGNITLDPIYEAKAYEYFIKNIYPSINNKKIGFWIVGNSSYIRKDININ